jgi:hypothetical protein
VRTRRGPDKRATPSDLEPLNWLLLTTLSITSFADAQESTF